VNITKGLDEVLALGALAGARAAEDKDDAELLRRLKGDHRSTPILQPQLDIYKKSRHMYVHIYSGRDKGKRRS